MNEIAQDIVLSVKDFMHYMYMVFLNRLISIHETMKHISFPAS